MRALFATFVLLAATSSLLADESAKTVTERSSAKPATESQPEVRIDIKWIEIDHRKFRSLGIDCKDVIARQEAAGRDAQATEADDSAFKSFLLALERNGLCNVLAAPSVLATTGRMVHFESGGAVPIKGQKAGAETIERFGARVDVRPTLLESGKIRLDLKLSLSSPVSQEKRRGATRLPPSIQTREAAMAVDLAPGRTFVLAGNSEQPIVQSGTDKKSSVTRQRTNTSDQAQEIEQVLLIKAELADNPQAVSESHD